ncbi:MAG: FAD-binding oxidoreductase [bacterium]|nr:FAD-binding oxidoreductase [bacterium]
MSINPSDLEVASHDESSFLPVLPLAVVSLTTSREIQELVEICNQFKTPITPRGAGSALEGNTIPVQNGIVLDLSRMNRILEIDAQNLQVTVEAGVIYDQLNQKLKNFGLFFPPSPGGSSDVATIGGMISTNASGIYSVKYGGTKEHVLELEVVTGYGEILKLGNKCIKRSSGYNLTDLICGSEGTLAIVTQATLKLSAIPSHKKQFAYQFANITDAVTTISQLRAMGVDLAAMELMDANTIRALNKLNHYGLPEQPILFFEVHGSPYLLKEVMEETETISKENLGKPFNLNSAENPWTIRHYTTPAIKLYQPNKKIVRNDAAFPIASLPEVVQTIENWVHQKQTQGAKIELFILGHLGLGILHALMLADPMDQQSWNGAQEINHQIKKLAIEKRGTISGEHGIGIAHKDLLNEEHQTAVQVMREIKRVFDPNGILNPDKIFPTYLS